MFEKISHIAEQAATNVSRRQFLGRFGRSAAVTVTALGGFLTLPAVTQGGKRVQHCSSGSSWGCVGKTVGAGCDGGNRGSKCQPRDKHDKSPTVWCYCDIKGPSRR